MVKGRSPCLAVASGDRCGASEKPCVARLSLHRALAALPAQARCEILDQVALPLDRQPHLKMNGSNACRDRKRSTLRSFISPNGFRRAWLFEGLSPDGGACAGRVRKDHCPQPFFRACRAEIHARVCACVSDRAGAGFMECGL